MKPIRDCAYPQEDGCCGHPNAFGPECHTEACPRLSPDVYGLLDMCQKLVNCLPDAALDLASQSLAWGKTNAGIARQRRDEARALIAKARGGREDDR